MDAPLTIDDDTKYIDTFVSSEITNTDNELIYESLSTEIKRSLATLSDKEIEILNMYFGIGYSHEFTLEEIGNRFDLTRERVRQIKEKAIRRLQKNNKNKLLKQYL